MEKTMEYKVSHADYLSVRAMREIGRQCAELVKAVEAIQKVLVFGGDVTFVYGPESVAVSIVRHGYEDISADDEPAVHIMSSKNGGICVLVPASLLVGRQFSRLVPSFLVDALEAAKNPVDRFALVELCFGHVSCQIFSEVISRSKQLEVFQVNDLRAAPLDLSLDTLMHATTRSIHELDVPRIDIRALFAWHILNRAQSSTGTTDAFEEPDDAT
jgi:hypothetical protein